MKTQHKETIYDEPVSGDYSRVSVRVKIKGLIDLGNEMFKIEGLKPRNIDWDKVRVALGYEREGMSDSLLDKIGHACFQHDVTKALIDRIDQG